MPCLLAVSASRADNPLPLVRALTAAAVLTVGYLLVALASRGGLGAGDVKLAGLLGLALGWQGWAAVLAGTVAAWVAAALFLLLARVFSPGGQREVPMGPAPCRRPTRTKGACGDHRTTGSPATAGVEVDDGYPSPCHEGESSSSDTDGTFPVLASTPSPVALLATGLGRTTAISGAAVALLAYNSIQIALYGLLGATASGLLGGPWWAWAPIVDGELVGFCEEERRPPASTGDGRAS